METQTWKSVGEIATTGTSRFKEQAFCSTHGLNYEKEIMQIGTSRAVLSDCPECEKESNARKERKNAIVRDIRNKGKIALERFLRSVPKRYQPATLDNYRIYDKKQNKVIDSISRYSSSVFNNGNCGNAILLGGVGTGKTHLAVACGKKIAEFGHSTLYTDVGSMFSSIRAAYSQVPGDRSESEPEKISRFVDPDYLILDEVGVSRNTDWEQEIFFRILGERYNQMKPMMLISNFHEEHFETFLGERLMSRLVDRSSGDSLNLAFDWEDYRIMRRI